MERDWSGRIPATGGQRPVPDAGGAPLRSRGPVAGGVAQGRRSGAVFVVCHTDDQTRAAACFPAGTEFVTGGSGDAVEQLSAFLNALEGKVIVITKPCC